MLKMNRLQRIYFNRLQRSYFELELGIVEEGIQKLDSELDAADHFFPKISDIQLREDGLSYFRGVSKMLSRLEGRKDALVKRLGDVEYAN